MQKQVDILVVGGGINGVGIARDAAGRGLSVMLCEKDDLAAHTGRHADHICLHRRIIRAGMRFHGVPNPQDQDDCDQ